MCSRHRSERVTGEPQHCRRPAGANDTGSASTHVLTRNRRPATVTGCKQKSAISCELYERDEVDRIRARRSGQR